MSQPTRRSKRFKMESPVEAAEESKPTNVATLPAPSQGEGECSSCKELVENPVSCTKCQKFFCWKCFDVWLSFTPRTMCPVCVGEVKRKIDSCMEHDQELNLFCLTCGTRICSGCFLNATDHKRHQIDDFDVVYREKRTDTNGKLNDVGDVLEKFQVVVDTTRFNEELICKTEETIYLQLEQLMNTAKADTVEWKDMKLSLCKLRKEAPVNKIRHFEELRGKIDGMAKHEFIAKKEELELEAADLVPNSQALCPPPIGYHDYKSSMIPQCRMVLIVLENFSRYLEDPKYDLISSADVSDSSETFWTVRVFKGKHLTVDFSQKQSLKHSLPFQLFVEIFNTDLRNTLRVMQDTQSTNCHIDLIEMDKLKEPGFISESDEVSVSIWIRPWNIMVEREALTLNFLDLKRQKIELDDKHNRVVAKLADSEQYSVGYLRIPLEKLQFPEQSNTDMLQIKSHMIKDFSGRSWRLYVERVKANRNCAESYIGVFLKLCSPLKKKTSTLRRRYYVQLVNKDSDYSIQKCSTDKFNLNLRLGWCPFVRMSRVFADNSGFVRKGAIGFRFGVQNKKWK
ncbi:E3 ubiquitin-protein ligase TRIM37-like [Ochlerotatus camptorhynchus]|uniref:E3 ubiquitin-protein ligase TRIM37-like n=1 Tax=Ochlerotatus camptorhynchus TaxID=644619 RepID=UPI0031E3D11D